MCKWVLIREWKTAETVQELKNLIGDEIVIDDNYKGQAIKPDQCLCCVDMEATAKLHDYFAGHIGSDIWFKKEGIDSKSDNEIVSALVKALEKAVNDYGKPGGPWNVPDEPGTWLAMAQAALAKARGEENEQG